ncbi:hypothetical protein ZIOFF_062832 [Zingiber officinale]|uniref:Polyprotein n=1 Tax=Zingiber officinale TaxID=94328 RepID=A0A8J5KFP3_ZINOF|nr:hypothetical protein ZIOFF_062832 [Zingiber officinale]
MQERASLVPTEVLYHSRRDDANHRVYIHRFEEAILVTDGNQVDRSFIQEENFNQLQRSNMQYIHLGILQVRIQILHRKREGAMALIVFRDNRWQGDQSILVTMEVYLTQGSQMVYVIPETMLTIVDFFRSIQISILTKGYEAWKNGEVNLLITRGLVDLELPAPSWDDEPTKSQTPNLPKEAAAVLVEESELPHTTLEQAHAGETSLGATVLRSMETTPSYGPTHSQQKVMGRHLIYLQQDVRWNTPVCDDY